MKKIFTFTLFFFLAMYTIAQSPNPDYDTTLAAKFGADGYGMKNYVLVILKTGSNKSTDQSVIDSCFKGHMKNINRLVDMGKLVVAGPLGTNEKTYRGIFILDVKDTAEANALLQADPAIHSKFLDAELYKWYGSAALPQYLDAAKKVGKVKF